MDIFVLGTSSEWERGNGAAVVIAQSIDRVEEMLREYEMEETLRVYEAEDNAAVEIDSPSRHLWVEIERFPTDEKAERVVIVSWDEVV